MLIRIGRLIVINSTSYRLLLACCAGVLACLGPSVQPASAQDFKGKEPQEQHTYPVRLFCNAGIESPDGETFVGVADDFLCSMIVRFQHSAGYQNHYISCTVPKGENNCQAENTAQLYEAFQGVDDQGWIEKDRLTDRQKAAGFINRPTTPSSDVEIIDGEAVASAFYRFIFPQ